MILFAALMAEEHVENALELYPVSNNPENASGATGPQRASSTGDVGHLNSEPVDIELQQVPNQHNYPLSSTHKQNGPTENEDSSSSNRTVRYPDTPP